LSTEHRARSVLAEAEVEGTASQVAVPFADLTADDLVGWRLGMAHVAPFVAGLDDGQVRGLRARATALLGPFPPPLVRTMIVLRATS
jgi:hypothetical protein